MAKPHAALLTLQRAPAFDAAAFQAAFNVSRETMRQCEILREELKKWQQHTPLIGRATMAAFWHRHMADCAQAIPLLPPAARCLADIGSGAGFPALVLGLLLPPQQGYIIHAIEAHKRKAKFLEAMRERLGLPLVVHAVRAEEMQPAALGVEVVLARAVAPLAQLLDFAAGFFQSPATEGLFFKGKTWAKELTLARQSWTMRCEVWESATSPASALLRVRDVRKKRKPQSSKTP